MPVNDDWDAPDEGPSNSDAESDEVRSSSSDDEQEEGGNALGAGGNGAGEERRQGWYVRKLAKAGFADVQPDTAFVHQDGGHVQSVGGWVDYDYQLDPDLELPNSVALSLDTATVPQAPSDSASKPRGSTISAGGSREKSSGSVRRGATATAWAERKVPAKASKYGVENLALGVDAVKEEEFGLAPHHETAHSDVMFSILFAAVIAATIVTAVVNAGKGWGTYDPPPVYVSLCVEPCQNGATCSLEVDECICLPGYFGLRCENSLGAVQLPPGYIPPEPEPEPEPEPAPTTFKITNDELRMLVLMLAVMMVSGMIGALVWFMVLFLAVRYVIWFSFGLFIALQLIFGVAVLVTDQNAVGAFFIFSAAFSGLLVVVLRRWVPFAQAMLQTSALIVRLYPGIFSIGLLALLFQIAWLCLWFVAAFGAVAQDSIGDVLLAVVALYWVPQVLKNIVHVTTAGAVASWYFGSVEKNAVAASFRRATTKSFGTICYGSLVVAILQAIHFLGNIVNRSGLGRRQNSNAGPAGFCLILVGICTTNVLRLMEVVNHYAYTDVAIYGHSMMEAARSTFQLLRRVGLVPLMGNHLLQSVIMAGAMLSGLFCVCVAGVFMLTSTTLQELAPGYTWAIYMLCFLIGYIMTLPLLEIVQSVVCALFICFASQPDVLEKARPQLYKEILIGYEMMTGGASFVDALKGRGGSDSDGEYEYDYEYEDDTAQRK